LLKKYKFGDFDQIIVSERRFIFCRFPLSFCMQQISGLNYFTAWVFVLSVCFLMLFLALMVWLTLRVWIR